MYPETIFTIDARENVALELLHTRFKSSPAGIYDGIRGLFKKLIDNLVEKKINYQDLKGALIPRADKKELALVFDTKQIQSFAYSSVVFNEILPLLEVDSTVSCLCGDYITIEENKVLLKQTFVDELNSVNPATYSHHSHFFIVYFNNLSDRHFSRLIEGLRPFAPFTGYFDLTFSSTMKVLLSTMLIRLFIKYKRMILLSSEENEDGNSTLIPFDNFQFSCVGIEALGYGIFLSYKIERQVFAGYEADSIFGLYSITRNVLDINEFKLVIDESKLDYLLREKFDNLHRAGMHLLSARKIAEVIRNKVNENYFYNLCYLNQYNTAKFNLLIEVPRTDVSRPMKLTAALEYIDTTKELRLITMF